LRPVKGSLNDDDAVEGVIAADPLDTYLDSPVKGSEYADAEGTDAVVEAEGRCRDAPLSRRFSVKDR
jgi:hypothetical protein